MALAEVSVMDMIKSRQGLNKKGMNKMGFYKNHLGKFAKVINSHNVIVMFEYRTLFFPDMVLAAEYLRKKGYTKI